jgi:calcineurin-like phosphoesterase family protein
MIYFTSDQHFDHENAIEYCDRPFSKLHKMNWQIIYNFNKVVCKDDTTYHIGDFTLRGPENWALIRGWLKKLNGKHILIMGNHDKLNPFSYVECGFQSVHTMLTLHGTYDIMMIHDPAKFKDFPGSVNFIKLFGHSHQHFKIDREARMLNVGVDVHDFYPVSINRVLDILINKKELKEGRI